VAYIAHSGDLVHVDSGKGNKHVILKESVLPLFVDDQSRKKAIDKFEQEALLLKRLDSPHIVKLLDYFIEDHRTYFVLEHIDGLDLRKIVEAEGAMTSSRVLAIAKEMSEILDYLHNLSPPVVHRDFTADNLVLGSNNKLKLIDFEVAHEVIQKSTATVVGKHCYIPPEQLRGKPEPASDLYAMGCTLYYLYTGKEPEPLSRQSILTQQELATAEEDTIVLHNIINQLTSLEPNKRLTNRGLRSLLKIENCPSEQQHTIKLEAERELAP
jgi:serine/threonine protein kinase